MKEFTESRLKFKKKLQCVCVQYSRNFTHFPNLLKAKLIIQRGEIDKEIAFSIFIFCIHSFCKKKKFQTQSKNPTHCVHKGQHLYDSYNTVVTESWRHYLLQIHTTSHRLLAFWDSPSFFFILLLESLNCQLFVATGVFDT